MKYVLTILLFTAAAFGQNDPFETPRPTPRPSATPFVPPKVEISVGELKPVATPEVINVPITIEPPKYIKPGENKTPGVVVAAAQENDPVELVYSKPKPATEIGWKYITETANRNGAKWYYRTWRYNKSDDVEVWLKVVPANPQSFVAKATTAAGRRMLSGFRYMLQFTVFHCDDKRMSVEKMTMYRQNGSVIAAPTFLFRTYREPMEPGSINEYIWRFFCLD